MNKVNLNKPRQILFSYGELKFQEEEPNTAVISYWLFYFIFDDIFNFM